MDDIKFTSSFNFELSAEEGRTVFLFLQKAPAEFSRKILNRLEAVAQAQAELEPVKKSEG